MDSLCECGCGKMAPIATKTNVSRGHVKGQPVRFIRGHYKGGSPGRRVPIWDISEDGRMATGECKRHGIGKFVLRGDGTMRYRCQSCASMHARNWNKRRKETLVKEHGGKCVICGYDRYLGAFHFHHRDRTTKEFHVNQHGPGIEAARVEAKKCILLCGNCHSEVEGGFSELP
jgi:hypothetical protein